MEDRKESTHSLVLNDGRSLSYSDIGDKSGIPIFFFHGFPGSRLDVHYFEVRKNSSDLGLRFISVDRPGYGHSDFQPKRTLLDWPDDVRRVADNLNIDSFSVLGFSGGGPYALACACKIPDRLLNVGLVSTMGPYNTPGTKDGLAGKILRPPGFIRALIFRSMMKNAREYPDKLIRIMNSKVPKVDSSFAAKPIVGSIFKHSMNEAFRSGIGGSLQDAKINKRHWGFELSDIQMQINMWHGELDQNVPIQVAHSLAESLPNCTFNLLPDEGHISLLGSHTLDILKNITDLKRAAL